MECLVFVTEKLMRAIKIEAKSEYEALEKVKEAYRDEEIVLDYNDYISTNFEVAAVPEGEKR